VTGDLLTIMYRPELFAELVLDITVPQVPDCGRAESLSKAFRKGPKGPFTVYSGKRT
jgi:hypothetical protein